MKSQEVKSTKDTQTFSELWALVMPRQNGTPAGVEALRLSILRGKGLIK